MSSIDKSIKSYGSDGYQIYDSGVKDIAQAVSGGITTWTAGTDTQCSGDVVLTLSQSAIDQMAAGSSYFSSITLKFPAQAPKDVGTFNLDLSSGSFIIPDKDSGKAFENTMKGLSSVNYTQGDPSGVDLDKNGSSDILLSWTGGKLLVEVSPRNSVLKNQSLTADKQSVMNITDNGGGLYFSTVNITMPKLVNPFHGRL